MTPALAFFYGGLVAQKNIINTLLLSFVCVAIVMVQWVLIGYSLAFEPGSPCKSLPSLLRLILLPRTHTLDSCSVTPSKP